MPIRRASGSVFRGWAVARFSLAALLVFSIALALKARGQHGAAAKPALTARFGEGGTAAEIPMELAANAVFVPVQIGGRQPSNWLLDTASPTTQASLTVDPQAASDHMPQRATLVLPGVTVPDPTLGVHSFESLGPWYGLRVAGVLGNDLLAGLVAELDYARLSIELYSASTYHQPSHMEKLPIRWVEGLPTIRARVRVGGRTITGNFVLNTGGSSGVVVFRSAQSGKPDLRLSGKTAPGEVIEASGEQGATLMRGEWLDLGPVKVSRPIVTIAQENDPSFPSGIAPRKRKKDSVAGWIGGQILRKFRVVLDFPENCILLTPNREFVFPIESDASGATITATGSDLNQFEVRSVRQGSPAAQAGLEPEDRIVLINGENASDFSLDQIRDLLAQAGHSPVLVVERAGKKVRIDLHLQPGI
jgi:hypothetical protein